MTHKKSLSKEFYGIISDFNVLYFLLALCYIIMTTISIIKLNDIDHEKDKWYVVLTLVVYIIISILYILLSYFTYHR